jgi:hypothetical protein
MPMDLKKAIEAALATAVARKDEGNASGVIHRNRSKHFVEVLADALRQEYSSQPAIRVFSKHYEANRREFGMNEVLYDVLVAEAGYTEPIRGQQKLAYLRKALWQIESEFAHDSRKALFDFNKLVVGAAERKLFVGPQVSDDQAFRSSLLPAAQCCSGEVYLALLPHPKLWKQGQNLGVALFRCTSDGWARA